MTHPCRVCGTIVSPFNTDTLTAHEFNCYKREPGKVPEHHTEAFAATLLWEKRSAAAKRGAKTRRGLVYQRARRPLDDRR